MKFDVRSVSFTDAVSRRDKSGNFYLFSHNFESFSRNFDLGLFYLFFGLFVASTSFHRFSSDGCFLFFMPSDLLQATCDFHS